MLRLSEISARAEALSNLINGPNAPIKGIRALPGAANAPSVAFAQDSDTGMYNASDNAIGISAGGNQVILQSVEH
jgi:hypothetical protein